MIDAPQYRRARPDDVPALHALIEGAYRGESSRVGWTHEADYLEGPRTSAADLVALIAAPESMFLMFHRGDTLIACAHLSRKTADRAHVGMLAVDPRLQAGGLGKHILAIVEAEAVRCFGVTRLALTVVHRRSELIAYYERRGFALTGERLPFPIALEPPLFLLAMEKTLIEASGA